MNNTAATEGDLAPASMGESMAVLLARDFADHEKVLIGTNSDIQLAACALARHLQAPRLSLYSGPGGMVNPEVEKLISTADPANIATAEAWLDLDDMVDLIDWKIHFFDFSILSVLQVDRFGNINTVCVGDPRKPSLRGPGTVGISALCGLAKRFYVITTRHDRNTFVPRVDFLCGAGFLDGDDARERAGLPDGGPRFVISPLGIFDFHPKSRAMRVRSLSEGVTLKQVQEQTGFDLLVEGDLARTAPVLPTELTVLRSKVDRTGVLRRKFP